MCIKVNFHMTYRSLNYLQVDESMVDKHHIVTTTSNYSTQVDTYRYPRAGILLKISFPFL